MSASSKQWCQEPAHQCSASHFRQFRIQKKTRTCLLQKRLPTKMVNWKHVTKNVTFGENTGKTGLLVFCLNLDCWIEVRERRVDVNFPVSCLPSIFRVLNQWTQCSTGEKCLRWKMVLDEHFWHAAMESRTVRDPTTMESKYRRATDGNNPAPLVTSVPT